MKITDLLNLNIQYYHIPIINFFYLFYFDRNNTWYVVGFVLSFIFIYMLKVAVQHQVRIAKETGKTNLEEVLKDSIKEKANGVISLGAYILYIISFTVVAMSKPWNFPYTHLLLLLNVGALISQLTTVYYERKIFTKVVIKPAFNKWKKRKGKRN